LDDSPKKGEEISERITGLRDSSRIPSIPACMMQMLITLRNIAVYEKKFFGPREKDVVTAALASLEEWAKTID
jgi:hypothetical protein